MRQWIDVVNLFEQRLAEADIINFPGNPRPVDPMAVARGGAEVRGFPTKVDLDSFATAYVTAALWSSTDDDGEPLDRDHDTYDIASPTLQKMAHDCAEFQQAHADLLDAAYETGYDDDHAGHDFWLTRNRHGAGFWDRGLGRVGKALTDAAHRYGEFDLYIGDDGMIHGG
jgi:hypothetical protein